MSECLPYLENLLVGGDHFIEEKFSVRIGGQVTDCCLRRINIDTLRVGEASARVDDCHKFVFVDFRGVLVI